MALSLEDLGLEPVVSAATENAAVIAPNETSQASTKGEGYGKALVPGSMLARVLYAAFSRQPVCVIDSPPGAGKTSLIVDALAVLLTRSDYKIVVACPTKRGARDLAGRLAAELDEQYGPSTDTDSKTPCVVLDIKATLPPKGTYSTTPMGEKGPRRSVVIRTIASCTFNPPECDMLIFDEAYQATYADVSAAADGADQVIMVGDPGQIGPVVTQDTSAWKGRTSAPHLRAPEVFARRDDAVVFQMDATYRLGQATVDAIAPLYGFPFASKRPDRYLSDKQGNPLPELRSITLDPAEIDATGGEASLTMMKHVAEAAIALIGTTVHTTDEHGDPVQVTLRERDVAVVVGRNVQATGVQAILRANAREGIAVGTADKMQGGQWHAVVALDPLTGQKSISPFQLNLGRLCVMASRHLTSMVWISDGRSIDRLGAIAEEHPEALPGIAVRRHLTADQDQSARTARRPLSATA